MNVNKEKIELAAALAQYYHQGQMYGDVPYMEHIEDVVNIASVSDNDVLIIGAYLHDILEDTSMTIETIETLFGRYVAYVIHFLTDAYGYNRKERKRLTYDKVRNLRPYTKLPEVFIIKAADRLANVRNCVMTNNHSLLKMYKKEHSEFREVYFIENLCDAIWYELDKLLEV